MSKRPAGRSADAFTPRVRWVPKCASNDADDAIFLASAYGLAPDAWQADILHGWLGRTRAGKWAAGRCGLAVPRQNGKNGAVEIRELFGMVVLGEAFLHTAHEVKTARKAFKRLKHFFGEKADDPSARFPELNALVREVRNTNGQEAIFLHDTCETCRQVLAGCDCGPGHKVRRGGSVEFVARSKGSGRGFTVDVLILDEAQALTDDELEAIRSAVSSAPLGNAQVIYLGTPPNRDKGEDGAVWLRIRSGAGKDKRLAWIEYGAPDGPLPDLEDRELLFEANPALELRHANGAFGLQMDVVTDERGDLGPEGYARERLGWWGDPGLGRHGVIDMTAWVKLKVEAGAPSKALLVVDVSPDLEFTSIGVASEHAGRTLVLVDRIVGTDEAPAAVAAVKANLDEVLEVALTPTAKVLSARLTKLKVEHEQLTNAQVGAGCVGFQDMVRNRTAAHVGQQVLDDAVRNGGTRYVGDTQHWDRRNRKLDISALVAGSTAAQRWALLTAEPDEPPPSPVSVGASAASVQSNDIMHAGF